jgi:hypothetical protein
VQANKESRETHLHAVRQNRTVYVTGCGIHGYQQVLSCWYAEQRRVEM